MAEHCAARKRRLCSCLLLLSLGLAACGASPAATLRPAATATLVPSLGLPSPTTPAFFAPHPTFTPAPTATKSASLAELVLRWEAGAMISDVDDVSAIATRLRDTPGIVDGFGDEIQITITYDPQKIAPEAIQRKLADLGYPTRRP